jgi:hypothetical protein
MLNEAEWAQLTPFLASMADRIQSYREKTGASIAEAAKICAERALNKYFELTGFRESNVNALWHHRLSHHGPPCLYCGKLLRTTRAARCVECGRAVSIVSVNPAKH